jgi:hypothetical protein
VQITELIKVVIKYMDGGHFHSAQIILPAQSCRPQAKDANITRRQKLISTALLTLLCPTLEQEKLVIMPRLRGTPRRGAAWYRAASRRKYLQRFEKVLALASTRRKKRSRRPAKAMVESAPVAHHAEHTEQKETPKEQPNAAEEDYYPHCIIEEGIPQSTTPEQGMNQEIPPPTQEGTGVDIAKQSTADTERQPAKEVSVKEETMSSATGEKYEHPSLVFELRSMLDDLNFRVASTNQRIDMLLSALSTTAPKKQCPTCAKEFWIPAGWRQEDYKRASPGPG